MQETAKQCKIDPFRVSNYSFNLRNMTWIPCLILLSIFFLSVSITSESFDAMEGEAFVVKCPKRNSLTFKWYHMEGNKTIPADEGARIHSSGRFLWFLPTAKEDSGYYTCVTQYSNNLTTHSRVSVMVYPYERDICFPSQIRYPKDTGTFISGRVVCPTIDNYENATLVHWYKDCKLLQGKKYFSWNKYLYIKAPVKTDEGYYTCQFTYTHSGNEYNVSATRLFVIKNISEPKSPQIIFPEDNDVIEVVLGAPVNISCKAFLGIGNQNVEVVTWDVGDLQAKYLDPLRFQEDYHRFSGTFKERYGEAVLRVTEVKQEDLQSNFTCVALNAKEYIMATVTLQESCEVNHHRTYMIIGFLILLVMIVLLIVFYHFFLIDIVLLYRKIFNPYTTKDDGKMYDAYVIYPTDATSKANFVDDFVHQILPDVLENKCGYKLCIYGREIFPGEDVANAIETRIQKSRRSIIILTPKLIHCKEFAYDQHIALHCALIQDDIKAIVLEMETNGDYKELQESLRYIIKQQGTIKWKKKYTAHPGYLNSKFWKHVRYHMPLRYKPSH
ncbi:interleukin-1 receptor-like 1 isoform X1 [Alligator sinensis]|uniref:Interleukin-1 receptor-like 1 isoform X1 n=2 Tax=Alligator sinensis TaxID=38654 RepID=A0A3Q0HBH3_ALLSI|nr:interleukin-1 receptor-like 1 isoform X1 [Alligator sinensis]